MIRRENRVAGSYFQMHKAAARDVKLSFGARGLLAFALTHPDDFALEVRSAHEGHEGKKGEVYTLLNELGEAGYIELRQERSRGRFAAFQYDVFEVPDPMRAELWLGRASQKSARTRAEQAPRKPEQPALPEQPARPEQPALPQQPTPALPQQPAPPQQPTPALPQQATPAAPKPQRPAPAPSPAPQAGTYRGVVLRGWPELQPLIDVFEAHRGKLQPATPDLRLQQGLTLLLNKHAADAPALVRDATLSVADDKWWQDKGHSLQNLLGTLEIHAKRYREKHAPQRSKYNPLGRSVS